LKSHYIKVEDIWFEIVKSRLKHIVGGIYRHPNRRVTDVSSPTEDVLSRLVRSYVDGWRY